MPITRRNFLAATPLALAPFAVGTASAQKKIPVGLELFSVRAALQKDLMGTVRAVAKMGYEDVEFYAPYFSWTLDQAKEMRKLMDDLGIRCLSTHNALANYKAENVQKAIDYNGILGSKFVVVASAGRPTTLDGWKTVADSLAEGHFKLKAAGLRGGYHNHQAEFTPVEGKRPVEVLAAGTPREFMMQFDVGTCLEMGSDPVKWINDNPGRINSMHLKDWNKERGYRVLFGEGAGPWKEILAAAEKVGGLEFVLIEQEGSDFSEFETAQKCLDNYRRIRA
jgi:sugar phosphate isomerase/epimerase